MTRITRLPILAATMAAGLCLMPTASNKAVAQITFSVRGITPSYYSGYSSRYTHGHVNGYGRHGYSTYGNGPYGYGSVVPYGYPSTLGYGYRSGTSYNYNYNNYYYRGLQIQGGTYRPVYRPNATRYYSVYGYGYRGYLSESRSSYRGERNGTKQPKQFCLNDNLLRRVRKNDEYRKHS